MAAAAATLAVVGTAAAERGGAPGPPPQGQGQGPPPQAQGPPEQKNTPPGQEQRGDDKPAPPGQGIRNTAPPRRPAEGENRGRGDDHGRGRGRRRGPSGGREDRPPEDRGGGQPHTRICHRTASETNPWVLIEPANPSLPAHSRHGDIIPAPAGDCPGATATSSTDERPAAQGTAPPAEAGSPPPGTPVAELLASTRSHSPAGTPDLPASGVLGAFEENEPVPAAVASQDVAGATTTGSDDEESLPFTGLQLVAMLLLGAASLGIGAALLRTGTSPTRI